MPQSVQHPHFLLLWVTILSISHMVFIALFFTAEQRDSNSCVAVPNCENATLSHIMAGPPLGKGSVLNFKCHEAKTKIKWKSRKEEPSLISEENGELTINKDGDYLLGLQVTLSQNNCQGSQRNVSLKKDKKILLQRPINHDTCSTGFMGKALSLQANNKVEVTVEPPVSNINSSEAATYLDIIYLF